MIVPLYHDRLKKLEQVLGYYFTDKNLLIEALTHPSVKQNNDRSSPNYERLELLGDAVLNFIVTEILFINFSYANEGKLAKVRAYLICSQMLCNIAYKLNLGEYIIMSHGEENSNGRSNPSNLENATEALIGAIYLDSNIEQIKDIIKKLWGEYLDKMPDLSDNDPKTTLQEWAQSRKFDVPVYEIIEKSGSDHEPLFTVKASVNTESTTAQGKSIKLAQKEAARNLLKLINTVH